MLAGMLIVAVILDLAAHTHDCNMSFEQWIAWAGNVLALYGLIGVGYFLDGMFGLKCLQEASECLCLMALGYSIGGAVDDWRG